MRDTDPLIRRIERDAVIWCGLATAAALAIRPDAPAIAAGVVGGGLLAIISLLAIRSSVDAVLARLAPVPDAPVTAPAAPVDAAGDPVEAAGEASTAPAAGDAPSRAAAGIGLKLAGRYLVLALAAYVMMARLRLHPVGLLIGASSLVAGATFEAVRSLRRP